jgi:hypothetical protein
MLLVLVELVVLFKRFVAMRKKNKTLRCKDQPVYSKWVNSSFDNMRTDAMRIYLEKNDWLEKDVNLNVFNIVKFKEHFFSFYISDIYQIGQTENLTFEQAIEAIRIYEKIDSSLKQNQ